MQYKKAYSAKGVIKRNKRRIKKFYKSTKEFFGWDVYDIVIPDWFWDVIE